MSPCLRPERALGIAALAFAVALVEVGGRTYAAWVDVAASGSGTLLVADTQDGSIVLRAPLVGAGRRYVEPLFHDGVVWTTSCDGNSGPGVVESFTLMP